MYFKRITYLIISCIILFFVINMPTGNDQNFEHSYVSFFNNHNLYSKLSTTYYLTEEAIYSFNVEEGSKLLLNIVSKDIPDDAYLYLKCIDSNETLFELSAKEMNGIKNADLLPGRYELKSSYESGTTKLKILVYNH